MKAFFAKYREIVAIIIYVAVVGTLAYFGVFELLKNISSKSDNIQEEILIQEGKKKRLDSIPAYREKAAEIARDKEKLDVFVSKENALALIEKLESISQEAGVTIEITIDERIDNAASAKKTSTKKEDVEKTLAENLPSQDYLSLEMDIYGEYPKIMNFVWKLENIKYVNDVISLQIEQEEKQEKDTASQKEVFGNNNKPMDTPIGEDVQTRGPLHAVIKAAFYLQSQ